MTRTTESRSDKLGAAHDKLQEAVAEIVSGDGWQRMLKEASKFHRYSFNNQLMIFLQRPNATVVAGFNKWKSLGRFVKKGEKASPSSPRASIGFRRRTVLRLRPPAVRQDRRQF